MRASAVVVLLAAAMVSPAAAQGVGAFEFGAFGGASYFDRSLQFEQGKGGGGLRLGFFALPRIELEGEASLTPTPAPNDALAFYIPLRARLMLNVPAGTHSALLFGGGYVRNEYRHDLDQHDDGATALVGLRLGLNGLPSIRVSSYLDYIPSPWNGAKDNVNWGLQFGLSFLFGKGAGERLGGNQPARAERPDSAAARMAQDSLARADSLRQAAAQDSLRLQAQRDSLAQAAKADSLRAAQQALASRQQAVRDSMTAATRADSVRTAALRDSLRLTRNRARIAALNDSLARVALRDSLRAMMATKKTSVTLRGVNFEVNKAVLLAGSRDILTDVARSLVANPDVTVEVAGHTDNTGPRELNERLSQARADSVKVFLIENGVEAGRMESRGYAWDQPVASNKTAAGRAQNRRVELRRTD